MLSLEKRFYSREEIGQVIGIDSSNKNFARKVKDTLQKWGYSYEYKRKGVTVLKVPETVEEKIAEIAQRELGLDVQCDSTAFAAFLFLLQFDEDFNFSPWSARAAAMKKMGIEVSESTLRRWASKLIQQNIIIKDDENRELWFTVSYNGEKHQSPVLDEDMEAYQAYCQRRRQLLEEEEKNENPNPWKTIFPKLWQEFKAVYYYCKPFTCNAIASDNIREMLSLVEDLYVFEGGEYILNDEVEETHIFG